MGDMNMAAHMTVAGAVAELDAGRTTARALVEHCLERIADPGGEGARVFVAVHAGPARAMADAMDALRRVNRAPAFAGVPISLKDLFDVRGEPTRAGSAVLHDAPAAAAHAPVVARLLDAGFVPVGRTNMTEFAFSGIGINPHHGTPAGPWDRGVGHVPGGSSSGAAVSVADGMALMGLGTDTGGSTRIPAAFCGIVGYKPTARRVPIAGVLPLATSLDSVGPIARTVRDCALVDAVLAGGDGAPPLPGFAGVAGLRLAAPSNIVLDGMDAAVGAAWTRALARLEAAGARITHMAFPVLDQVAATGPRGTVAAAEALAWHRDLLAARADGYDPRVRVRIERGAEMNGADLAFLLSERVRLCRAMDAATAPFDALVMPTAVIAPPTIASLIGDDEAFGRTNALVLRNTAFFNYLDRCAISMPCHRTGEPPAGLMLVGETMGDARLLALAEGVEAALAGA